VLGLAWGLGHAATLLAFGPPILLLNSVLSQRVQQSGRVTFLVPPGAVSRAGRR
jgi:hypothetical protein